MGVDRNMGCGAAMAKVGCSFIELNGAGVGDARVGCTPYVVMLFLGARMPGVVGATVG